MNGAQKGAPVGRKVAALCTLAAALSTRSSHADIAPNHVRDVKLHAADGVKGGTEIDIIGTTMPVYSARVADGGKRLLVDLENSDVSGAPPALTEPSGVVGGILTQAFKTEAGIMTRLAISLSRDSSYRLRPDGTTLHVTLTPNDGDVVKVTPSTSATPPVKAEGKAVTVSPEIREVKFERVAASSSGGACPKGCDRVVIDLTSTPSYKLTQTPSGRLRMELKGARVPDAVARTLDVRSYRGPVRTVATFHDGTTDTAILEIEREGESDGNVVVDGSRLVWAFDLPKDAKKLDPQAVRHVVTVAREAPLPDVPRVETSIHGGDDDGANVETSEASAAGFTSTISAQSMGQGRYNGRRINLDLKDADIHNILRLLADVGHVNIVTADDVSGTVTISMKNVPWDQALDVVLQAKGLGMVRAGNLIRVAPASVLNKERELRLAQLKQELELAPLETRLIPVSYAQAEEMQARARDLLSPRGSIAVDERTNFIIARDVPGNLDHVEELVHSLDTQTPQVLVEARIVEATSKYLRDVGIQWGGDVSFAQATGNPTGIAFPSDVTAAGGNYDQNTPTAGVSPYTRQLATPNFAVNLPAAVGTGAGGALGLAFGSIDNTIHLDTRLSAAESSGLVRIVSAPRVLTLDNREARINQGTLLPFSQVSAQGVQTTFQEAKLQLLVRPHVTADGSVSMHVKINRDEPDFTQTSARGDPTILKREAETDLLVMDGHTAVIGGIFTRNTGRNLDQIPFFGDIPIIGILFQRRRASDSRNELVIFLTPRIVNRAEALGR